jgi:hypothetical protein
VVEKRNGTQFLSSLEIIKEETISLLRGVTRALFMEKAQYALNYIFNTVYLYLYSLSLKQL